MHKLHIFRCFQNLREIPYYFQLISGRAMIQTYTRLTRIIVSFCNKIQFVSISLRLVNEMLVDIVSGFLTYFTISVWNRSNLDVMETVRNPLHDCSCLFKFLWTVLPLVNELDVDFHKKLIGVNQFNYQSFFFSVIEQGQTIRFLRFIFRSHRIFED